MPVEVARRGTYHDASALGPLKGKRYPQVADREMTTMSTMRPLLLALVFALLSPCWLEARCPTDLASVWRVAKTRAGTVLRGTVFRGTVRDVRMVPGGQVVAIEADRVWLGRVPRNLIVYNRTGDVDPNGRELTSSTAHSLTVGERYIIFTHEQTSVERQLFGTTDSGRTYGTQGCGIWRTDQHDVRVLGKGREVSASTSSR
jgi:hypothetical protein